MSTLRFASSTLADAEVEAAETAQWHEELAKASQLIPPSSLASSETVFTRGEQLRALKASPQNPQLWVDYLATLNQDRRAYAVNEPREESMHTSMQETLENLYGRATRVIRSSASMRFNPSYAQLWIDSANLRAENDLDRGYELFKTIKSCRIGQELPRFWNSWADLEEKRENPERAARFRAQAGICEESRMATPSRKDVSTPTTVGSARTRSTRRNYAMRPARRVLNPAIQVKREKENQPEQALYSTPSAGDDPRQVVQAPEPNTSRQAQSSRPAEPFSVQRDPRPSARVAAASTGKGPPRPPTPHSMRKVSSPQQQNILQNRARGSSPPRPQMPRSEPGGTPSPQLMRAHHKAEEHSPPHLFSPSRKDIEQQNIVKKEPVEWNRETITEHEELDIQSLSRPRQPVSLEQEPRHRWNSSRELERLQLQADQQHFEDHKAMEKASSRRDFPPQRQERSPDGRQSRSPPEPVPLLERSLQEQERYEGYVSSHGNLSSRHDEKPSAEFHRVAGHHSERASGLELALQSDSRNARQQEQQRHSERQYGRSRDPDHQRKEGTHHLRSLQPRELSPQALQTSRYGHRGTHRGLSSRTSHQSPQLVTADREILGTRPSERSASWRHKQLSPREPRESAVQLDDERHWSKSQERDNDYPIHGRLTRAAPTGTVSYAGNSYAANASSDYRYGTTKEPKLPDSVSCMMDFCGDVQPERFIKVGNNSYLLLGQVGKGGSSKVYKVLSRDMEILALKRVRVPLSSPAFHATVDSYANEIDLLKRLRGCPTIIQLHDAEVERDNGLIQLIMEYGEVDLAKRLRSQKKEKIGGFFKRVYWQQMLEAVHTIHEARIVHGDLKPANFLVVGGVLKLIDFGIARAIQTDDTTKIIRDSQIGTPNYMAPEALMCDYDECDSDEDSGSKPPKYRVGRASDIWSLGCILYQMSYGRTPFAHVTNTMKKINFIQNPDKAIAYPNNEDADLLEVLQGCLQRDPQQRMSIPELLKHPFMSDGPSGQRRRLGQSVERQSRDANGIYLQGAFMKFLEEMEKQGCCIPSYDSKLDRAISETVRNVQRMGVGREEAGGRISESKNRAGPAGRSHMTPTVSAMTRYGMTAQESVTKTDTSQRRQ